MKINEAIRPTGGRLVSVVPETNRHSRLQRRIALGVTGTDVADVTVSVTSTDSVL